MNRIFNLLSGFWLIIASLAVPAHAGTVVSVTLWDAGADLTMVDDMRIGDHPDLSSAPMRIKVSRTTVPAGQITFKVMNASQDLVHEMIVGSLANPEMGLPYLEDSGRVDEDQPGVHLGEVPELEPGQSGTLTMMLKPGTYVLFCNLPGHYATGMWNILTVR